MVNNQGIMHCAAKRGGMPICGNDRAHMSTTRDRFEKEPKQCKRCLAKIAKQNAVIARREAAKATPAGKLSGKQESRLDQLMKAPYALTKSEQKQATKLIQKSKPVPAVDKPINEKMMIAMLTIMDDKTPAEQKKPIHKATVKALAARGLAYIFEDGIVVLTAHGRKTVLGNVAKVVTPRSILADRVRELEDA